MSKAIPAEVRLEQRTARRLLEGACRFSSPVLHDRFDILLFFLEDRDVAHSSLVDGVLSLQICRLLPLLIELLDLFGFLKREVGEEEVLDELLSDVQVYGGLEAGVDER